MGGFCGEFSSLPFPMVTEMQKGSGQGLFSFTSKTMSCTEVIAQQGGDLPCISYGRPGEILECRARSNSIAQLHKTLGVGRGPHLLLPDVLYLPKNLAEGSLSAESSKPTLVPVCISWMEGHL